MEFNMNSFGLQYNRFATNFTNPYLNTNIVANPMNPTTNQCYQCSDQPLLRNFIQSNVNSYHIQSTYNNRKCNFQKQFITTSTSPSTSAKLSSTFTIDSILDTKNTINSENPSLQSSQNNVNLRDDINEDSNLEANKERAVYNWLRCTRYKPPKVKKRSNSSVEKRKTINRGPRIPFTSFQISELENKFRLTHYLSSLEVNYLATKLNLTDSRIRIWFQNRRARDKREKRSEELSETVEEGEPEIIVDSCAQETDSLSTIDINYLIDRQKKAPLVPHHSISSTPL